MCKNGVQLCARNRLSLLYAWKSAISRLSSCNVASMAVLSVGSSSPHFGGRVADLDFIVTCSVFTPSRLISASLSDMSSSRSTNRCRANNATGGEGSHDRASNLSIHQASFTGRLENWGTAGRRCSGITGASGSGGRCACGAVCCSSSGRLSQGRRGCSRIG
jgi:hypothetical protein